MNPIDCLRLLLEPIKGVMKFLVIPFGLTNAPATFQALMNHIFAPYLRKFVLVFFDDILIYNSTLDQHLSHLKLAFQNLRFRKLYVRRSKCSFAEKKVEYLGHVISGHGVSTDPHKIEAMKSWPRPKTLKELRRFLGLTGL